MRAGLQRKERWIFSKCHRGRTNACFVRHSNSIMVMENEFLLSSPSCSIQDSCPHTPTSFRQKNTTVKWPPEASKRLDAKSYCCIDLIAIFSSVTDIYLSPLQSKFIMKASYASIFDICQLVFANQQQTTSVKQTISKQ